MDRTVVYAQTNGEPRVVEASKVDSFLANGYIKDFMEAENLDLELLEKTLKGLEKVEVEVPWFKIRPYLIQPYYDASARFHYSFFKALQAQAKAQLIQRTREEADKIKVGLGKLRKAVAPDMEYHRHQKLKRKRRQQYGVQNVDLP